MPNHSQNVRGLLAASGLLFILACSSGNDEVVAPTSPAIENTAPLMANVWRAKK